MALAVLSVAYPLAPVGPDAVGGAEQVLSALDRALIAAGHRSLVLAQEGSDVAGTLVPVPRTPAPLDDAAQDLARRRHREALIAALALHPVDVVHLHGVDFFHYLPPLGVPVLVSLHCPAGFYPADALRPERPNTFLHAMSRRQHEALPQHPSLLPPIENGVAVPERRPPHAKRGFALVLSRICPEKGIHLALDAAHAADMALLVGGEVFPYPIHQAYFAEEVRPRLDARRRFLGPVGLIRKRRLLAAALCLVVPSLAEETSSLVAREALAHGTPVVAFPSGALADTVEHGATGFLVRDVAEMAVAMREAAGLDPERCREAARQRFPVERMVERYFGVYLRLSLTQGGSLKDPDGSRLAALSPTACAVAEPSFAATALMPSRPARASPCRSPDFQSETLPHGEESEARPRASNHAGGFPGQNGLAIETIRDPAVFKDLAPAWLDLWRLSPTATPFQSPAWALAWWQAFHPGELRAIAVRRAERLVALAPLYLERGARGARLLPLGVSLSDNLDILVDPDVAEPGISALSAALASDPLWESLEFCDLPPGAAAFRLALPLGWKIETSAGAACPTLDLSHAPRSLEDAVPAAKRRKLRMAQHRAARRGGVRFIAAGRDALPAFFAELVRLHGARWQGRGEGGVLADPRVRAFHAQALPGLHDLGVLRLIAVEIAGRIAGVYYGFHHRDRAMAYLGGFDPDFAAESPGTLLIGHAVERAIAEGAQTFDFLRGGESYKYQWGARDRPLQNLNLTRRAAHAA